VNAALSQIAIAHEAVTRAQRNLDPASYARLESEGLDVVLVRFATEPKEPICFHPQIGEALGCELAEANAGRLDSALVNEGGLFCFFHVTDLAKALAVLKRQVQVRSLLPVAHLMHRETSIAWRCYFSPLPGEIGQMVYDETE